MADYFPGPRAITDPAADITGVYAFPSPEWPGHLVLVLNVFPAAAPTALFSDAVRYRFRVRPVMLVNAGAAPAFTVGADEHAFTFAFTAPVQGNDGSRAVQAGTCTTPGGQQASFRVGEPARAHGLRIFAGARQNVLSIVAETDIAAVSCPGFGPLVAVVGETVTSGRHPVRLQLVGRPEIKNVSRDPDGETDWPPDDPGTQALARLLLADFLVVDTSKPYSEDSFFEIEAALLAGRPHTTCGGRSLSGDFADAECAGQATQLATRGFPYLVSPNPDLPDLMDTLVAQQEEAAS
ncbi:MAG: hypothetical protein JWM19_2145 [Actinomycetia bacterium]|nr:hypothetical protein [Actinomycetes bacterium]